MILKKVDISIFIVLLLASVYFISQFLRSALGITILSISIDLHLNYEQIGMLGGIFFLSFALVQIPLGILLDKFDPLKVIILMLLIIYIGTIVLSFANILLLEVSFFLNSAISFASSSFFVTKNSAPA